VGENLRSTAGEPPTSIRRREPPRCVVDQARLSLASILLTTFETGTAAATKERVPRRWRRLLAFCRATAALGRYCCKSPRGTARPGKFGNNRIRIVGSVNQISRFDPWARKLFFVPAPKIVLQQYRPAPEILPFRAHWHVGILIDELPKGCAETTGANWQQGYRRPAFTFTFSIFPSRNFTGRCTARTRCASRALGGREASEDTIMRDRLLHTMITVGIAAAGGAVISMSATRTSAQVRRMTVEYR
jgi:hypothetical protein